MFKKLIQTFSKSKQASTSKEDVSFDAKKNNYQAGSKDELVTTQEPIINVPLSVKKEFSKEGDELVENLKALIEDWHKDPQSEDITDAFRRALHTLKGSAKLAQFGAVAALSHDAESYIEESIKEDVLGDRAFFIGLEKRIEKIEIEQNSQNNNLEKNKSSAPANPDTLHRENIVQQETQLESSSNFFSANPATGLEAEKTVAASSSKMDLKENKTDKPSMAPASVVEHQLSSNLSDDILALEKNLQARVDSGMATPDIVAQLEKLRAHKKRLNSHGTKSEAAKPQHESIQQTSLKENEKEHAPFSSLLPMLKTLKKQLESETGKAIDIHLAGLTTQLPQKLLSPISSMLGHLIRNSMAHGIEASEQRQQAGKPVKGQLYVSLHRNNHQLVLSVEDDGDGVDLQALRQSAHAKSNSNDDELLRSIFNSGVTTSEQPTELSGRGMGLNAVREQVKTLNGSIECYSQRGLGTKTVIHLLLLPKQMESLHFLVNDCHFAIDEAQILASKNIQPGSIVQHNDQPVFVFNGEQIAYLQLSSMLANSKDILLPQTVLVIDEQDKKIALGVDRIVGSTTLYLQHVANTTPSQAYTLGTGIDDNNQAITVLNTRPLGNIVSENPIEDIRIDHRYQPPHIDGLVAHNKPNKPEVNNEINSAKNDSVAQPSKPISGPSAQVDFAPPESLEDILEHEKEAQITSIEPVVAKDNQIRESIFEEAEKPVESESVEPQDDEAIEEMVLELDESSPLEETQATLKSEAKPLKILFALSGAQEFKAFQAYLRDNPELPWQCYFTTHPLQDLSRESYDVLILSSESNHPVDLDVLAEIKKESNFFRLPVVVNTTLTSDVFRQRAHLLGANYVLHKPYTLETLKEVVDMVSMNITVVEDLQATI